MERFAERLVQVGEEIQRVENELRSRRRLLGGFLGHLRPANPAVIGDRMGAAEERIRGLERRLQMLRNEQQSLIVRAVTLGLEVRAPSPTPHPNISFVQPDLNVLSHQGIEEYIEKCMLNVANLSTLSKDQRYREKRKAILEYYKDYLYPIQNELIKMHTETISRQNTEIRELRSQIDLLRSGNGMPGEESTEGGMPREESTEGWIAQMRSETWRIDDLRALF